MNLQPIDRNFFRRLRIAGACHLDLEIDGFTNSGLRVAQDCGDTGRIGARKLRNRNGSQSYKQDSTLHRCMHQLSTLNDQPFSLPVVIDMTPYFAFIKLDARLFVLHRFKQRHGLPLAHLTFFLFSLSYFLLFIRGIL